ncbi:MAG: hemerythrin domain-containing protein [Bacteroidales bacterium]|nr:hemerythrin domain-containing protein [Bacteroidales bacterium]
MESIFTRHTKLSEILRSNWQLAALFPRLHIYWGFGEQTIEQYCTEHRLSTDFAIMICNAYTFENYSPQKTDFINFNCQDLTDFLLNSHVFYLQKRLPHIKQHLQHVVPTEHEMAAIVNRFFNDYIQEVQAHFEYEEKIVFPYISGLLSHSENTEYSINIFEEQHDNMENKLNDLISLVMKYLPSEWKNEERTSLLINLSTLLYDMQHHACIEEHILIPYVKYLEHEQL